MNRYNALRALICLTALSVLTSFDIAASSAAEPKVKIDVVCHEPIDGTPYISNLSQWKKLNLSTQMIPWEGEHIVLMTTVQHSDRFEPKEIKAMVRQLDQAWNIYAELIPESNRPKGGRKFKGKGVIAATPGVLAGAIGLGAIGSHGIEVTTLYSADYGPFVKNGTLPNYYIYEMGRNWFTFGEYRYGLFTSSFAVHMGMYAVNNRMRVLNGKPPIEHDLSLLKKYVASDKIDFDKHLLQNHGYALKDVIGGGDRNNLYGMILYELERQYGDEFLKRFYACLVRTPTGYWPQSRFGGLGQVINWTASASYGAKENLAERFVTEYHVPLSDHVRNTFKGIDWSDDKAIEQFATAIETTSSFAADGLDNDAVIPAPRDANWVKRHEATCKRAAVGGFDLLMIGDSITDGWNWRTGDSVWKNFYADRKALNLGVSGDRTQHVLWRLKNGEIDGLDPAVAVLMIGTNNAMANKPAQTAAGVTAIVELLRRKLPRTKILLLAIFPRGAKNDWLRGRNNQVNATIAKLADGRHVHYLDINGKFLAADGALLPGVMFDGLHPSTKGYQIWAETMEPTLAKLLSAAAKPDGKAPPNELTLTAEGGHNAVRLSWAGGVARDVIACRLLRGKGDAGELRTVDTIDSPATREYIDRSAKAGVVYRYALQLVDAEQLESPKGETVQASAASFVLRINCGGAHVPAWDGADWEADDKAHKHLASTGTKVWTVKQSVSPAVAVPAGVLQTERWANQHVQYKLPVEAGRYELTLWFVETNRAFQVKGKRTVRIRVNESDLAEGLDVFAEAGADTPWAWRTTVNVEKSPLHVGVWADPVGPTIKGIELRRVEQPAESSVKQ